MRRLLVALVVIALVVIASSAAVTAQSWSDAFNYPAGTIVGNWVEHLKDWQATGTAAMAQDIANYQHMTQPKQVHRDCCVECVASYNTAATSSLQFGGVIIRANNPGAGSFGSDLIHVKYQGSGGNFSIVYLYENNATGGLSAVNTSAGPSPSGRLRVLAIDNRVIAQVDTNQDGKWDAQVTKTVSLPVKSGPVGVCGYGGALVDTYRVFNAVLAAAVGSPAPNPGNTIQLVMRGSPRAPYIVGLSLGKGPIGLSPVVGIPLSYDPVLVASLSGAFLGFRGVLDVSGDGAFKIPIPKIPQLVGITFYTGFVNAQPGITHISNDHEVTIL